MAFSSTNLFTTLGKFIKHSNIWNGYFTALNTAKSDVSTVLNTYSLLDYFVPVPGQIEAFQAQVAGWIQQYASNVQAIILDETTVISQLPIASGDLTTVLTAISQYMVDNSVTIQSSVVTLGGSDADIAKFNIPLGALSTPGEAYVFVSRKLDGINAPSNSYRTYPHYFGRESQLAMSCTEYAKCVSSNPGQEVVQIFSELDANASYDDEAEKPGVGPSLTNIESNNLVPSNFDFSNWSGDNPVDWTVTPGVSGTDWEDMSGTGEGPLRIGTVGTYAKQKITGLQRERQYFFGAVFNCVGAGATTATVKFRVENSDGSTVHSTFTSVTVADVDVPAEFNFIYGFYAPSESVNLDDIYLVIEHDAESDASNATDIYRVAISPVTFYNGLGHVFWNPITDNTDTTYDLAVAVATLAGDDSPVVPLDAYGSIAIVNNGAGVIQSYCRKVLGIQFPTADSPSLADSLAT